MLGRLFRTASAIGFFPQRDGAPAPQILEAPERDRPRVVHLSAAPRPAVPWSGTTGPDTKWRRPAPRPAGCSTSPALNHPTARRRRPPTGAGRDRSPAGRRPELRRGGEGFAVGAAGLRREVTTGEEGLHRPSQRRDMAHRIFRLRIQCCGWGKRTTRPMASSMTTTPNIVGGAPGCPHPRDGTNWSGLRAPDGHVRGVG